jgi:hypothetical protein
MLADIYQKIVILLIAAAGNSALARPTTAGMSDDLSCLKSSGL